MCHFFIRNEQVQNKPHSIYFTFYDTNSPFKHELVLFEKPIFFFHFRLLKADFLVK